MINNLYEEILESSNNVRQKEFISNSTVDEQLNNIIYINKSMRRNTLNSTSPKIEIQDTTNVISEQEFTKQEFENKKASMFLEKLAAQMMEILKENYFIYKHRLSICLEKYDYSFESLLLAEDIIQEVIDKFEFETLGRILQDICLEYYDKKNILCAICQCMERFDLEEVHPWGVTLMLAILQHKDENVKAYAIASIDNWADKSLLQVIKNIDCTSDWLKNYVSDVIARLEV